MLYCAQPSPVRRVSGHNRMLHTLRPLQNLATHAQPRSSTSTFGLLGIGLSLLRSKPSPFARSNARATASAAEEPSTAEGPHSRFVLIAVDPDTKGAIAVATWHQATSPLDPATAGTQNGAAPAALMVDMDKVDFKVFDMPCAEVALTRKSKTTGQPIIRRTVDVHSACMLIAQSSVTFCDKPAHPASIPAPTPDTPSSIPHRMQAFVEAPPIMPSDGGISRATTSYTSGLWHGLLSMGGFLAGNVTAREWKRDLGLTGQSKDASRLLAGKIFPQMQDLIMLKKHHGRAEALLMAAWALGLRVDKTTQQLTQGPVRTCVATDAYGNAVRYSNNSHVPDPEHCPEEGEEHKMIYADVGTLHKIQIAIKALKKATKKKRTSKKKAKAGGLDSDVGAVGTMKRSSRKTKAAALNSDVLTPVGTIDKGEESEQQGSRYQRFGFPGH